MVKLSICTGLRALMRHITGSTIAKPNTVKVEFMSDEHGAIFVSTCANVITLLRGVFVDTEQSYATFKMEVSAAVAVGSKPFNTA